MFVPADKLAGLTPWLCTYRIDNVPYGITLYSESAEQIERDWREFGDDGITVDGKFVGYVDTC